MNYYLDTEFLEGPQKKGGKPTIDLISIGIVADDGSEYYAISKDFNLKQAWNRWQWAENPDFPKTDGILYEATKFKLYWLRENILRKIFVELIREHEVVVSKGYNLGIHVTRKVNFTYRNFKWLLKRYGKTQKQIANEIVAFVYQIEDVTDWGEAAITYINSLSPDHIKTKPVFYAYFASYDWVVFCWIFGRMMDLPKGFPMYCHDLKQMMVERNLTSQWKQTTCPEPANAHNALADARWNKQLHEAILYHTISVPEKD